MKRHRLLIYEQMSRQMRGRFFWLFLVLLAFGLYDQFTAVLGSVWVMWWAILLVVALLWLFYKYVVPRASIKVGRTHLRLQGPLYGMNISFRRIHAITSGHISQHYPEERLKRGERKIVEPFYPLTCLFIELRSYPKAFRWRRLWFPRLLFGTSRPGLICVVDDWMALSRDLESARAMIQKPVGQRQGGSQSLAAKILAMDDV